MASRLDFSEAPYITKASNDRWILHAPTRIVTLSSMDSVIEDHEKRAGVIDLQEALGCLDRRPKDKERWESMTEDEARKLQLLIEAASDGSQKEGPGVYMCEISWSTLGCSSEDPHNFGGRVTNNIRCR